MNEAFEEIAETSEDDLSSALSSYDSLLDESKEMGLIDESFFAYVLAYSLLTTRSTFVPPSIFWCISPEMTLSNESTLCRLSIRLCS